MAKAETMNQYLLKLSVALSRMFPNDESMVLRIMSETEDHLRQAVEKNRGAGLAPGEAEREAIRQFGPPETVAERFGRELGGVLSPRGLFVRSYVHLGSFVGTLVVAAGAACLVLAAAAAVMGPLQVLGVADPPPSYYLPQCGSRTPQEIAAGGPECTSERWGPEATVSHLWLTVGGAVILAVGAGLLGAHQALLRKHVGSWKDQSLPARVHAVLGVLLFGLVGLFVWPISAASIFSRDVSLEPAIGSSLAAGAVVTAIMFLAYSWYARSVFALRA